MYSMTCTEARNDDINRLSLLLKRVSPTLKLSDIILPYLRETAFGDMYPTWNWVEELFNARPPHAQQQGGQRKESFSIKLTWLRDKMQHMPASADPPTLCQYTRCRNLSWDFAVLAWTYHSLCSAAHRATTDIAWCMPLLMCWIYHRLSTYCPSDRQTKTFPLAVRYGPVKSSVV
ncbi:hypothetical protein Ahy_A03g015817 [Arachis hypogaea]|uniref:Aminotransferase-like plant mobile domain-containing protein n=1 Tax=Arachis hypogaea TaxID=3818 RepID=A0A445E1A7_ARAHY|nr:hypothetical protein Ahy_A03g015817 [Arachis hypogaea]